MIAVDSPWGTGKTTFLGFLRAVLESSGMACLYFDAWKTDFSSDPLIAFLGELNDNLPAASKDDTKFNQFFGNAKRIASVLARRAIPVAGKIATAGILDLDDFTEETISEFVGTQLNDAVDSYTAEKKLIQSFRENLSAALGLIDSSQTDRKLIIVVDELDRCKPTYAIQLLERIKHLFDLENVIFIVALDKQQLGVSLGAVYGAGIDADEYLRRFFDLEYSLPKADPSEFTKCLYERFGFDEFFDARTHSELRHEKQHLLETFVALSQLLGLSLRAREQCFSRIRIALLMTKENHFLYPILVSTLAMLKVANPSLYRGYAFGSTTSREVIDFLASKPGGSELLNTHFGAIIEAYLVLSKSSPHEECTELVNYRALAGDSSIAHETRERASRILEIANHLSSRNRPQLRYVVGKLELAAQFER
ncbi:hypothetical protein H6G99_07290 [Synechococcus sp. FACHB-909]|nr:hypothetical protein [Synechococcus sp. FACHB-909]